MKAKASLANQSGRSGISPNGGPAFRIGSSPDDSSGSNAPPRGGLLRCVAVLTFASLLMVALVTPASADERIGGSNEFPGALLGGGVEYLSGLAVSEKEDNGGIYTIDRGLNQRIDLFEPSGQFVRAFGWGVVPDAATATGNLTMGSNLVTEVKTTSGNFHHGDFGAGEIIEGPGIPPGTQITQITSTELKLSNDVTASGTGVEVKVAAGPGNVPTNERQELAVTATGGTYKLTFHSPEPGGTYETTTAISGTATHEEVQSALEALPNIEAGNVAVSGGPGDATGTHPYIVEFKGSRYADSPVSLLRVAEESLTGTNAGVTPLVLNLGGGALETCTTSCTDEISAPTEFEPEGGYGNGANPGRIHYADELAVNNDSASPEYGDVYVANNRLYRVDKYTPDGHFELAWGNDTVASGPDNSTNHTVQKVTVLATGGTYKLALLNPLTGEYPAERVTVSATATAAELQAALDTLPYLGGAGALVSVTGGPGDATGSHPYEITFDGNLTGDDVPQLEPETCQVYGNSCSFPENQTTLTGGKERVEVETTAHGGGPEICRPSAGDVCKGQGERATAYGAAPGSFERISNREGWNQEGENSIAVGPDGTVYVGDFRRIQEFEPDGTYKGQLELPEDQFIGALAVDSESHVYALSEGASDIQNLTTPPSGKFTLTFEGQTTTELACNATQNEIREALEALSKIGSGNVRVSANEECNSRYPDSIEFQGALAEKNVPQLTISAGSIETVIYGSAYNLVKLAGPTAANPSEVLATYDKGGEPTHLAIDEAGDLFVSDNNGGHFQFRGFKPDGALYAVFTSEQVTPYCESCPARVDGLAVGNAAGVLYANSFSPEGDHIAVIPLPVSGPPTIEEEEATNIEPATATLHGVVNPRGFDTEYRFEYISKEAFQADGNQYGSGTETTNWSNLGQINQRDPVQTAVSQLKPVTEYHYRVVAKNHCNEAEPSEVCTTDGADETFETLPPVTIRDFTTETVGPELVRLRAELNPNGQASSYTIRYGTDESYACEPAHTCAAPGTLPVGNEFVKVQEGGKEGVTFTGLKPNTEYHYQISVENSYGSFDTPDRTFTTELSTGEQRAAEDCPNGANHGQSHSTLREENHSMELADCRAYELTSQRQKEGGEAFPAFSISPSGNRTYYYSEGIFAGAEQNLLATQYLAERSEHGWSTQPVVRHLAPPPEEPLGRIGLFSPEMDRWLYDEGIGLSAEEADVSNETAATYFTMGQANGNFILHASPELAPVEGGRRYIFDTTDVEGFSNDLSHVFIRTGARLLQSDPREDRDSDAEANKHPNSGIPPEADRVYEINGVGTEHSSLRLAAEVPLGLTSSGEFGGGGCFIDPEETMMRHYGTPRLVSEDGSTLIYLAPIENAKEGNCGEGTPNPYVVFARTGEAAPVQLSVPPASQCTAGHLCAEAGARTPLYDGASGSGRLIWFTTTQPLINTDTDKTNDVYVAKLGPSGELDELVQASAGEATSSHPTPGSGADVGEDGISEGTYNSINQGLVRISGDGTHAAFVSPAVLTEEPNSEGQSAVQHANNLYVFDLTTNKTKFVGELCSGPEQSGSEQGRPRQGDHFVTKKESVRDPACPADVSAFMSTGFGGGNDNALWQHGDNGQWVQLTPDGNDLLFASFARLTKSDTDGVRDLYRFDFETGELTRVSIGRRGNDGNGNGPYPAELAGQLGFGETDAQAENANRAISEDGSVVIFRTAAPLVSHDVNLTSSVGSCEKQGNFEEAHTGCDLYEWEAQGHGTCTEAGGCISLVSNGREPNTGVTTGAMSSSGHDIAFMTSQNLVPEDEDGIGDIYDARVDGGFHASHPPSACTSPEACGEGFTTEPPAPILTTPHFVGPGNSHEHLECARGKHRVEKHGQVRCVANRKHKKHRKHHRRHKKHYRRHLRHHRRSFGYRRAAPATGRAGK